MINKLAPAVLALSFVFLPWSAVGGQANDTVQLRTVVVSASKVPQPASSLTQPVTVLSGDDLRARGC